jgi:hypothetical protein
MNIANYIEISELDPIKTPSGYYWVRDVTGSWHIVEISYTEWSHLGGRLSPHVGVLDWDGVG